MINVVERYANHRLRVGNYVRLTEQQHPTAILTSPSALNSSEQGVEKGFGNRESENG